MRLMQLCVVVLLALACFAGRASAQPFNVRAWYAEGQVFVVWQFPAPPAAPTDTVEIYASAAAQVNVGAMTRVGRLFFPEYTGTRLRSLIPGATFTVPAPGGASYTLAPDEGVFAFTPRAAGNLFFAVVNSGAVAVVAANSDATAFNYDPVNDPVRPHEQGSLFTPGGNLATVYAVWGEGRQDHLNRRPDVPVLGNAGKNGIAGLFVLSEPVGGVGAGPLPVTLALHGGGGEYQLFLPGVPARAPLSLPMTDGIVVTPLDSIYNRNELIVEERTTAWFGYDVNLDPFTALPRTDPASTTTVVNFTQRRVFWILDWLAGGSSPYTIDTSRVAVIGHSNGARGASHLSRTAPDRFCSVVLYCPPLNFESMGGAGLFDYLRGDPLDNLATNLPDPDGTGNVGVLDIFTATARLSAARRDIPLTRAYFGKYDADGAASWNATMREKFDAMDDSGLGFMLFWDGRDHGVENWLVDNPPAGFDVGQWVTPVRSRRPSAQYLVDTYRAGATYPGFFDVDQDPASPGVQLDPGDGNPAQGDAWGTWGGYFDWERATVVDTATKWEATVFALNTAAVAIDNSPSTLFRTSVGPRYTTNFNPAVGSTVYWYTLLQGATQVAQQGTVVVDADGRVAAPGVLVPREDVGRVRLFFSTAPLCIGSQSLTNPSSELVCPGAPATLSVAAQGSGPFAFAWEYATPAAPGTWIALTDGVVAGVGDVSGSLARELVVTPAVSGNRFRVRASNSCGSLTSTSAIVSVRASCCDSVDFNNDGVFPDDQDLLDFIAVLGGGACALCNDVDFNNDGVFPDDGDLEAFLLVLGGGVC